MEKGSMSPQAQGGVRAVNTAGGSVPVGPSVETAKFAHNVFANWAGHFVFIVSGFILPRFINDQLGQERLGVWDFGWSSICYLALLNAGIASSVNRFVARYRATSDWVSLNRTVSACACVFTCTAAAAVVITLILVAILPHILPSSFSPYYAEAQALLFFLGLTTALGLWMPVYGGVISGSQRYDLLSYIEAGCQILLLLSLVAALVLGCGLRAMAILVLACKLVEAGLKFVVAHRVVPSLRISPSGVTLAGIREVAAFGGKTFLNQTSKMILYQGNSVLIAFFLGPSSLAIFARSIALINHANKLLYHFARVFTPVASSRQASEGKAATARLVLLGVRYSMLISLPIMLVLLIMGDSLLRLWMGAEFATLPLLAILAVGHFASQAQVGAYYTLAGMDRHGALGVASMAAAILSIIATSASLILFGGGLLTVAISVGVSLSLVNLLVVPLIVVRAAKIPIGKYASQVASATLIAVPFAACLVAARLLLMPNDYLLLAVGLPVSGIILGLCYWRWALPASLKYRILQRFGARAPEERRSPCDASSDSC